MPPTAAPSDPRTLLSHPELTSSQSFPVFRTVGAVPRTALDRVLSVFADVRAGEGVGALMLALNVFLLLGAYQMLKPARDALVLSQVGSVGKAWAAVAQTVLLMGIIPLYGWLASKVARVPLITATSLVIVLNLLLFSIAGGAGVRVGVAFFIWLSIVNQFVVSQFWAFANDLYTEGQGRRLFPMVGVGQSVGALAGVSAVPLLVGSLGFTPYSLMLLATPVFLASLALTALTNRRERTRSGRDSTAVEAAPLSREGGFQLLLKDRYLFWIGVLIVLVNVVNTTGSYVFDTFVAGELTTRFGADPDAPGRVAFATSVYGVFGSTVNVIGLILQLFVTSRVMRYMGVRGALFILPVLALINYSIIAIAPVLAIVRIGKVAENSTEYSIQNTVRQALFLPTSREAKYKAKAAIDTFCVRFGDLAAAGLFVAGNAVGLAASAFAWVNVLLAVGLIGVAAQIAREHRRRTV